MAARQNRRCFWLSGRDLQSVLAGVRFVLDRRKYWSAVRAPQAAEEFPTFRPLEGDVIINVPSVEAPRQGTLTLLFTHRFGLPIQDSSIHELFSFDEHADVGIGLSYAPVKNLEVGFYRSSELDVYEVSARFLVFSRGHFAAAVRIGEDWRTEGGPASPHSSFFAQAILALSLVPYARLTAVPMYLQRTNDQVFISDAPPPGDRSCKPTPFGYYLCFGIYENVFNVPVAASVALTRSITLHAEVTPRLGKVNARGVGWIVSVEKTTLGHRYCFTAGNQRHTTVDQYAAPVQFGEPFREQAARNIYLGFNIIRTWELK